MRTQVSILLVIGLLLAGCGSGSSSSSTTQSTTASYAVEYPSQYKETYFQANHCGSEDGDSTSSCECQVQYIEAHAPYKDLEEGSPEHAKAEEVLNEAPSHCSSEHTPSEEAAHNSAAEGQQKSEQAYSEEQKRLEPEEERIHKIQEKVEYEDGK
jgi:hypothetical protein